MSTELAEIKNEVANVSADVRLLANAQTEMMISLKEYFVRQEHSMKAQEEDRKEVKDLSERVGDLEIEQGKAGTERSLGKWVLSAVGLALIGIYLVSGKPAQENNQIMSEVLSIMKTNYGTAEEIQQLKNELKGVE